jgi:UDP-GlcNAc:undecaprenyl-phosphate/decaprenyl-phosphate GlcNAc-1-phosphate transferase
MLLEIVLLFAACALGTLVVTPLVMKAAVRLKLYDYPDERKQHARPVPRVGGAALFIVIALVSILYIAINGRIRPSFLFNHKYWIALAGGATVVFLLGLYDDVKASTIWVKFTFQLLAALIPILFGGVLIREIGIPFAGLVRVGWLAYPITILWIVGVTNAFNLIDGLDGLAGGLGLLATATLFAIGLVTGNNPPHLMLVTAAFLGAIAGFFRYNRHPAKIFLGDSGSMLIGYILSLLAIAGNAKKTTTMALLIPILIIGLPVYDMLFTMANRFSKKVAQEKKLSPSAVLSMFKADRSHIHHVLVDKGYSHRRTVNVLYGVAFLLASSALFAAITQNNVASFVLFVIGIAVYVALRWRQSKRSE